MDTAKCFTSGRSQAVRLPEAYRFSGTTVLVKHFGGAVLLLPADKPCNLVSQAVHEFEPGFELQREQPDVQQRPDWRELALMGPDGPDSDCHMDQLAQLASPVVRLLDTTICICLVNRRPARMRCGCLQSQCITCPVISARTRCGQHRGTS